MLAPNTLVRILRVGDDYRHSCVGRIGSVIDATSVPDMMIVLLAGDEYAPILMFENEVEVLDAVRPQ